MSAKRYYAGISVREDTNRGRGIVDDCFATKQSARAPTTVKPRKYFL
jgi:hypothetical protein